MVHGYLFTFMRTRTFHLSTTARYIRRYGGENYHSGTEPDTADDVAIIQLEAFP